MNADKAVRSTIDTIIAALSKGIPGMIPNGLKTAPAIAEHAYAISSPNASTANAEISMIPYSLMPLFYLVARHQ